MRKNKFIRRKEQSKKNTIILLILILGLGYAALQSNLNINGLATMGNPKWDIHWENVQVAEGSVEANTPVIDTAKTTVTYSVVLNIPGEYYEFTVDAVNSGTIDGMIESITSKLNGVTITNLPDYLEYSVSYSDGAQLAVNQLLAAGDTSTYKVRIKYRDDINLNQIPATNQNLVLQFTVKYKQADDNAIGDQKLYNVLKTAAKEGTYAKEYTGEHHDSFTEEPSQKIYHWYARNESAAEEILDKWNVIFAGICWQTIRTTDTGGVKMLFNGYAYEDQCYNEGEEQQIGYMSFNDSKNAVSYVGYMYNPDTVVTLKETNSIASGTLFGKDVTYSNGTYTLVNTSTSYDYNHHYSCNNTTGTCSTVRYYTYYSASKYKYIELNGNSIDGTLEEMLSTDDINQEDSAIKAYIDYWYGDSLGDFTDKIEDTIYCNDRSIKSLGAFDPNGGNGSLTFLGYSRQDLGCTNITDKFSVANNKAKLNYPVGLLTTLETELLNNSTLRNIDFGWWVLTPTEYDTVSTLGSIVKEVDNYGYNYALEVDVYQGVRPAISLKPGTMYISGDGSRDNPYVVE